MENKPNSCSFSIDAVLAEIEEKSHSTKAVNVRVPEINEP
jgi:hypothetical protein